MFEWLKIDMQLETKERDPDAGIDRKPAVLPGEHVGGGRGVEESLHAEPPHDTTAYLLGEYGQMNLSDRPRRQERRRLITGRHEDAIGDARMEMHVPVERRAEAVDEGDGTEPRACGGGTREACRSAQESLYSRDEDPRKGCDHALAVGEEAAQPLRHGDHPLAHGHWWDDMIDQVCGRLRHASVIAAFRSWGKGVRFASFWRAESPIWTWRCWLLKPQRKSGRICARLSSRHLLSLMWT